MVWTTSKSNVGRVIFFADRDEGKADGERWTKDFFGIFDLSSKKPFFESITKSFLVDCTAEDRGVKLPLFFVFKGTAISKNEMVIESVVVIGY